MAVIENIPVNIKT